MSSITGKNIQISVFGQSHSPAAGVVIDGLPAGFRLDIDRIAAFMARRAPGRSAIVTARKEADEPEILSGLSDGCTCGAPLTAIIRNTDARSGDYAGIADTPRPSHADYAAFVKYNGFNDVYGGGHLSGRLTAPLCFAGAVCMQYLESCGIKIRSHIYSVGDVKDEPFDPVRPDGAAVDGTFPVIDTACGDRMKALIESVRAQGDSVGGVIECAVTGVPAGVGDPMFDGLENVIAKNVFAIPAVKGVEFGAGFGISAMRGSEANDPFRTDGGKITTVTNNSGGINGGISNGMPIIFRAAFRPTPSIAKTQKTVNMKTGANAELSTDGRHDPCVVVRAVPAVEAAAAVSVFDLMCNAQRTNK